MANCPCIQTETTTSNPTVTSVVTYDGSALCIGFSSGNVNDLAEAIANFICALNTQVTNINLTLATLTIGSNSVTLQNITNPNCLGIDNTTGLTTALNDIIAKLCGLYTTDITTIGLTVPNCAGVTNGEDLTDAINEILVKLCLLNSYAVTWQDHFHTPTTGIYANPLIPYALAIITGVDVSALGVAKVRIPATDYWVDDRNVSKIQEDISLSDTADNYVYLDNATNTWDYAVDAVAIGGAAPSSNGEIVLKVRTGIGTITSITVIIPYYPIDNTLIGDDAVKARNLNTDVVSATGAIDCDATTGKLSLNVDNTGIEIGTVAPNINKLKLKDDGVKKEAINADVAGDGLVQNVSGALDVNVRYSVELDTDFVQLTNDVNAPGSHYYYGTNSAGSKGYHALLTTIGIPVDIKITAAEMALIKTTPKVLYANADVTKVLELLHIECFNDFGTSVYTAADPTNTIEVKYDGSAAIADFSRTFFESAANIIEEATWDLSNRTRVAGKDLIITMQDDPTYYGAYVYGDGNFYFHAIIRLKTLLDV
jgi:hypothetical protein